MVIHMMKQIPCDPPVMDPILRKWKAQGQSTNIVDLLEESPARSPFAAECLGRIATGGSIELRRRAVNILRNYRAEGASAVPYLVNALQDPDMEVRYGAACALESAGPPAAAAIPALRQATNDSSIMVQRASARARRAIETGSSE